MDLNRDDYCDECWLIVSNENQEASSIKAVKSLSEKPQTTVLSHTPQSDPVTEKVPTTVLNQPPQTVSVTEKAQITVLSHHSLSLSIKGGTESPSLMTTEKLRTEKNEDINSSLNTTSSRTRNLTPKSIKVSDIKSLKSVSQPSLQIKTSTRKVFSKLTEFTVRILSSTDEVLEGARPNDSDLCLACLVDEYHKAFDKNVLRNVCGSGTYPHKCKMISVPKRDRGRRVMQVCSDSACPRFKFWKIVDARGDGWKVDTSFEGCFPPPKDVNESSCFVTSSGLCSKEQLVELSQVGLCPRIMDEVRPEIEVSEWFCGQCDYTSRYGFKVSLLDSQKLMKCVYGECKTLQPPEATTWQKVTYTFRDYDPGVRYVLFHHGGQGEHFHGDYDNGYPGSKMAGASVLFKQPTTL